MLHRTQTKPTTHGSQVYMWAWQCCCAELQNITHFSFPFQFSVSVFRFRFPFQLSISAFSFLRFHLPIHTIPGCMLILRAIILMTHNDRQTDAYIHASPRWMLTLRAFITVTSSILAPMIPRPGGLQCCTMHTCLSYRSVHLCVCVGAMLYRSNRASLGDRPSLWQCQ